MIPTYKYMNSYWANNNLSGFIYPKWGFDYQLKGTKLTNQFDYNHNVIVSSDDIKTNTNVFNSKYILDYEVDDFKNKNIQLPFFYYPVYKVLDENNNKILTKRSENNLIQIDLTKNKGRIVLFQYEPPFFLLGDIITILTVICILCVFLYKIKNEKKLKRKNNLR